MGTIDVIKRNFFDSEKVQKAVDSAMRRKLSKFGAFVRTRSRSSIRKRKATSKPGQPPTSRTGLLKKFIFFSYDEATKTVVIGPAAFRANTVAPELLEKGGTALVSPRITRKWQPPRLAKYAARPYMQPAFAAELPAFLATLKDSVKG